MNLIFYQLCRPFQYWFIKHRSKWIYDWLVPASFTIFSFIIFYFLGIDIFTLNSKDGLVEKLTSFLQTLPGFYIAALAAIATFNKTDIDKEMPKPTPTVNIETSDGKQTILLTRRRFLCMLFAFLTIESIALIILSSIGSVAKIPPDFYNNSCYSFNVVFFFFFWQLIIATCLGLYYLGDRLHQPEI